MIKFYSEKRKAVFKIDTGKYDIKNGGWIYKEQEKLIIGETEDGYVTSILETSTPYWDKYGRYEAYMCFPIEIHKSRFVKWCSVQMELNLNL